MLVFTPKTLAISLIATTCVTLIVGLVAYSSFASSYEDAIAFANAIMGEKKTAMDTDFGKYIYLQLILTAVAIPAAVLIYTEKKGQQCCGIILNVIGLILVLISLGWLYLCLTVDNVNWNRFDGKGTYGAPLSISSTIQIVC